MLVPLAAQRSPSTLGVTLRPAESVLIADEFVELILICTFYSLCTSHPMFPIDESFYYHQYKSGFRTHYCSVFADMGSQLGELARFCVCTGEGFVRSHGALARHVTRNIPGSLLRASGPECKIFCVAFRILNRPGAVSPLCRCGVSSASTDVHGNYIKLVV